MMHCKCGAKTAVIYSVEVEAKPDMKNPTSRLLPAHAQYVRRNRKCSKGHRFTTVEIRLDVLEDG